MLILGIESSCDETAAAVVEDGTRIRSNVVASQVDLHAEYGGVVPEIASRAHVEVIAPVLRRAASEAGISFDDLDAVAVANRPGLVGSLLIGVAAAKALAWSLVKPIVGVDHVHAHLYAGLMSSGETFEDAFPAIGLVVSGGHTALYEMASPTDLSRLGGTIDDALGEAYDKAATILGLPYPGGPGLDRLAQQAGADDRAVSLPLPRLDKESLDFSFSGLKTAVLYSVRGVPRPRRAGGGFPRSLDDVSDAERRDTAASFQRVACEAVRLKLERAFERCPGVRSLIAGGGVVANSRLRTVLAEVAGARSVRLFVPPMGLCVDNAAMVAGLGFERLRRGEVDGLDLTPIPTTAC